MAFCAKPPCGMATWRFNCLCLYFVSQLIIAYVWIRFVGKPFSNHPLTSPARFSPAKLAPTPLKSYQMFFQMVTLCASISVILSIDVTVGENTGASDKPWSKCCKCDKNARFSITTTASTTSQLDNRIGNDGGGTPFRKNRSLRSRAIRRIGTYMPFAIAEIATNFANCLYSLPRSNREGLGMGFLTFPTLTTLTTFRAKPPVGRHKTRLCRRRHSRHRRHEIDSEFDEFAEFYARSALCSLTSAITRRFVFATEGSPLGQFSQFLRLWESFRATFWTLNWQLVTDN